MLGHPGFTKKAGLSLSAMTTVTNNHTLKITKPVGRREYLLREIHCDESLAILQRIENRVSTSIAAFSPCNVLHELMSVHRSPLIELSKPRELVPGTVHVINNS